MTDSNANRLIKRRKRNCSPQTSSLECAQDTASDFHASASDEFVNTPIVPVRSKWRSFHIRLIWTLVLLASFVLILAAGHFYCAVLLLTIMVLSFKEIVALKMNLEFEKHMPYLKYQRYYLLLLTIFGSLYSYLLPLSQLILNKSPPHMYWIVRNHTAITYLGVMIELGFFLATLRRHSMKYQFTQMVMAVLTCLFVVGQGAAQIKNLYSGMIWFLVPSTAVIVNDISAYICGVAWGKRRLIPRISPQKTVEGFLGAAVTTFLWVLVITEFLSHFPSMICPKSAVTIVPFSSWRDVTCEVPRTFRFTSATTPTLLRHLGFGDTLVYKPVWIHSVSLGAIAAFVAPLGGFFASAFKRMLKVKDFGTYIPGHGGVTDRFDCQIIMGMCTFVYLRSFVFGKKSYSVLNKVLNLDQEDRVLFFSDLSTSLEAALTSNEFSQLRTAFCPRT